MFLARHKRAFESFCGVSIRISIDHSKIAVVQITGSRERNEIRREKVDTALRAAPRVIGLVDSKQSPEVAERIAEFQTAIAGVENHTEP